MLIISFSVHNKQCNMLPVSGYWYNSLRGDVLGRKHQGRVVDWINKLEKGVGSVVGLGGPALQQQRRMRTKLNSTLDNTSEPLSGELLQLQPPLILSRCNMKSVRGSFVLTAIRRDDVSCPNGPSLS